MVGLVGMGGKFKHFGRHSQLKLQGKTGELLRWCSVTLINLQ
jgi:hypothetical protein